MAANRTSSATDQILGLIVDAILERTAEHGPELAQAVFCCSVPRWFDTAVIAGMCPPGAAPVLSSTEILQQFQSLGVCQPHPTRSSSWVFREDFRAYLLSRGEVTDHWQELQSRAAETFRRMLDARGLEGEQRFEDPDWRDLAIEWVYHTLCLDPSAGLKLVRQMCAEALAAWEIDFCSEFMGGLGRPAVPEHVDHELDALKTGIDALSAYKDVKALEMLYGLAEVPELTPDQESALRYWIGITHLRDEGRLAPALEQFEKARQLTPGNVDVHAAIVEVYFSPGLTWGRLDLAQEYANRARELAEKSGVTSDKARAYTTLGRIHTQQEDWDTAAEWYQKAIEAEPNATDGYWALSELYDVRRDVDNAIALIDKAVEIGPSARY